MSAAASVAAALDQDGEAARIGATAIAALLTPAIAGAAPPGPRHTAGAAGAGDPYFPYAGNGGCDVQHYDLNLDYTPPDAAPAPLVGQFDGVATIDLRATQDLDRFNLDLRGLDVTAVTVNGRVSAPPSRSPTAARPPDHGTSKGSCTGGSRPATAPSSWVSRRAP